MNIDETKNGFIDVDYCFEDILEEETNALNAITNWVNSPSINTFKQVYQYGFYYDPWPLYKIVHIIRNTVTGKYKEIAKRGYLR